MLEISFLFNQEYPEIKGWAIPTATDIALSLAILSVLGSKIPFGIKLFLTAYAIADDLGAVIVIAIFYTPAIAVEYLFPALIVMAMLGILNRMWVRSLIPYLILGGCLWAAIFATGLHATIAGVILAMFIPAKGKYDMTVFERNVQKHLETIHLENFKSSDIMLNRSHLDAVQAIDLSCTDAETSLQRLELTLTHWVSFLILPCFALANHGLVLRGIDLGAVLTHSITMGVISGLFIGKPLGVLAAAFLAVKLFRLQLGPVFSWLRILGVGYLGGIGFTMSLFVSGLSFGESSSLNYAKTGIIVGSLASALMGLLLLKKSS